MKQVEYVTKYTSKRKKTLLETGKLDSEDEQYGRQKDKPTKCTN